MLEFPTNLGPIYSLLLVLYGALILAVLLVVKISRDLRNLKSSTRSLIRGEPISTKLRYRTKLAQDVWNSLVNLQSAHRAKERGRPSLDETVDLGRRICQVSDSIEDASEEVTKILQEKLGHDLIASAVMFSKSKSFEFEMIRVEGLPRARVSESLLGLIDYCNDSCKWGFFNGKEDREQFDLRSFGVNSCLLYTSPSPRD